MKKIYFLVIFGLVSLPIYSQKLSKIVKDEFCQKVQRHVFSNDPNDDYYKTLIYGKIRAEFYPQTIDKTNLIVSSICKNDLYFNAILDITLDAASGQYLFTHLYSFLGMSRDNALALKNYILLRWQNNLKADYKDSTLKTILGSSKWYCTGMFYQRNGFGRYFEKDNRYISKFDNKSKTFEIRSFDFGYKGTYSITEKDSILICQIENEITIVGRELKYAKANGRINFKINYEIGKLTLSQLYDEDSDDCCYIYEFVKFEN